MLIVCASSIFIFFPGDDLNVFQFLHNCYIFERVYVRTIYLRSSIKWANFHFFHIFFPPTFVHEFELFVCEIQHIFLLIFSLLAYVDTVGTDTHVNVNLALECAHIHLNGYNFPTT